MEVWGNSVFCHLLSLMIFRKGPECRTQAFASASRLLGNHLRVVKGQQKENSIAKHCETSWLTRTGRAQTQVREGSGCLLGKLTMKAFRQLLIHASHQ